MTLYVSNFTSIYFLNAINSNIRLKLITYRYPIQWWAHWDEWLLPPHTPRLTARMPSVVRLMSIHNIYLLKYQSNVQTFKQTLKRWQCYSYYIFLLLVTCTAYLPLIPKKITIYGYKFPRNISYLSIIKKWYIHSN